MRNLISNVLPKSIAQEVGIERGDKLKAINNKEVRDIIDYNFLINDDEVLVEIEKPNGEVWEIEIEKEYNEDLGVEFVEGMLDKPMSCSNKCIFCFIDQNPKGMRETIYFKDDDSRLSFLQGNFITMTNMKDDDIDRIIEYKISPINISVHTTNPELRQKMLKNRFAGQIYERMQRLAEAGIEMFTQLVLVPGYNDGEELDRTIKDLYKLYPSVRSIAAVPLGITKHREGLADLKTYDKELSNRDLDLVKKHQDYFMKEIGSPFIRLSDEFYVVAERDVPEADFYDGFDEIADGVGIIRCFREEIEKTLKDLDPNAKGHFTIPTGVLAYDEICSAARKIENHNPNIKIDVIKVINKFYGEKITVTGLIVGEDLINRLIDRDNGIILLSSSMFRGGYELGDDNEKVMLDNTTLEDLKKALGTKVVITDFTGDNLIQKINENY